MTVSFRVRYALRGGHVHARVWSSEFGPDTSHGCNGTLVFRESEWPAFREALEQGSTVTRSLARHGSDAPVAAVEFVEDATGGAP